MNISVSQVYTSAACNRIPEIVDWNKDGLICFGASNAVVVYDTNVKGKDPLTVLCHHSNKVNSVKWMRKRDGCSTELISCSADKTAAIWSLEKGQWNMTSLLPHSDYVTCIHGVYVDGDDLMVYTGCIDSNVTVWERRSGVTSLKQTINLHSGLCLTLHAHIMPRVNQPILFCALDDHKIHVFAGDLEYHRVHTLVGHEDWVRGLDVLDVDNTTFMLASASQDSYIRLWRIQEHTEQPKVNGIRVEEKVFQAHGAAWAVKLEAVLAGHEGWVYGVQWHPSQFDTDSKKKYRLLSSSLDKTLIIWEPEGDGAWVERVRVGEVGGNGLGFYGSRFGPGDSILGHGYNGSFHIWSLDKVSEQWKPGVVCGGHFNAVEDVRWEPRGRYLLSASLDQTTRVHAPWRTSDGNTIQSHVVGFQYSPPEEVPPPLLFLPSNGYLQPCFSAKGDWVAGKGEWHEVARPQVHGYDLASLALVSPTTFVSAAEEKVIRVFRAPHNFVHNFTNITGCELEHGVVGGPEGASVPSLGLSNKAVFTGEDPTTDDNDGYFVPVELHAPPTEETLMQNTLWPELQKLYGHGYEVFALDASADGELVASTCKATTAEHAAVLLWETTNWQQIQKLVSHQLTVTQLAFSPDSQRLLSVSRDRRWTVFQRQQGSNSFELAASTDKKNGVHTRIIWCCAWWHDGAGFATGSRDGKICLWSKSERTSDSSLKEYALAGKLSLADASVTALAFAPCLVNGCRILAAGLETGVIQVYSVEDEGTLVCLKELDFSAAHHLTVKRLTFQPKRDEEQSLLLASCGADNFVRIHRITVLSE